MGLRRRVGSTVSDRAGTTIHVVLHCRRGRRSRPLRAPEVAQHIRQLPQHEGGQFGDSFCAQWITPTPLAQTGDEGDGPHQAQKDSGKPMVLEESPTVLDPGRLIDQLKGKCDKAPLPTTRKLLDQTIQSQAEEDNLATSYQREVQALQTYINA